MKKIFLVVGVLLLQFVAPLACYSQKQHTIDSLVNLLKTEKEDTNKVKTLDGLSTGLLTSNLDQSFEYATQQLQLAQRLNFKQYIINAYQSLAGYYYNKGDTKTALEYMQKAIPLIEEINNRLELGNAYSNLSSISNVDANFSDALSYSNIALEIALQLKDSSLLSDAYSRKATTYRSISDYPTALNFLFLATKISEEKHNKSALSGNYFQISRIYLLMGNENQKAMNYTELSLKIAQECSDNIQIAYSLGGIGEIYQEEKEWNKALDYFQQSLSAWQALGNLSNIGDCTSDIGLIYSELGQYDNAISSLNNALNISQRVENKTNEAIAYGYLGESYMKMKDYKSAINYLNKSVNISKEIRQKNNESCGLKDLSTCYRQLGNYKLAYNYFVQHSDLNDTILNESIINKTKAIEATYNFDKKEKEIALLTKDKALLTKNKKIQDLEIKKQTFLKNSFIAGSAILCFLLFILYRYFRTRHLLKLQMLRNKIASDLHDDVGSTLSSISAFSFIVSQQSKEVIPLLDQIGEYSTKMLESMDDIVWAINPENDDFEKIVLRMRSFAFEIMRAKNIDYKFTVDESVTNLKLPMDIRKNLYMIFKEATNNIIKYAETNSALFSISHSKYNLTMLIRDNGKGFDINNQTQGNGLKNMKKRASDIGATFLIESEPGKGTTIQLLIKAA